MAKQVKQSVLSVTKQVRMPIVISMTGPAASLKGEIGSQLIDRLRAKLPIKVRLGRGRKETIQIGLKA